MTQTLRRAAGLLFTTGLFSAIGYAVGWWLFAPQEGAIIGAILGVLASVVAAVSDGRRVGARLRRRLARMEQAAQAVRDIDHRSRENRDILEQLADVLHEHATVLDALSAPVPATAPQRQRCAWADEDSHADAHDDDLSKEEPPILRSTPDTPPPGMTNAHSDEDDLYDALESGETYALDAARRAAAAPQGVGAEPGWMRESDDIDGGPASGPEGDGFHDGAAHEDPHEDLCESPHDGPQGDAARRSDIQGPPAAPAPAPADDPSPRNPLVGAPPAEQEESQAPRIQIDAPEAPSAVSPQRAARGLRRGARPVVNGPSIDTARRLDDFSPAAFFVLERPRDGETALRRDQRLLERLPDVIAHLTRTRGDARVIARIDALSAARPDFIHDVISVITSHPEVAARLSIGLDAEEAFRNPDIQEALEALKPYGRRLALLECHDGAGRLTLIARQPVSHLVADPKRLLRNLQAHRVAPDRFQELLDMRGVTLVADHVDDEAGLQAARDVGAAMARGAAVAAHGTHSGAA